nr:paraquat-inducible protein A [Marinifaba aquimaris]
MLIEIHDIKEGEEATCPRCGHHVLQRKHDSVKRSIAISSAGLVLFFPAIYLPIMAIQAAGMKSSASLIQAISSLWQSDLVFVALSILVFCVIAPFIKLIVALTVNVSLLQNRTHLGWLKPLFKWYHKMDTWEMLEVFMLGILISIIKLKDMAELSFDTGIICFIFFMLSQLFLKLSLDKQLIWQRLHDGK